MSDASLHESGLRLYRLARSLEAMRPTSARGHWNGSG